MAASVRSWVRRALLPRRPFRDAHDRGRVLLTLLFATLYFTLGPLIAALYWVNGQIAAAGHTLAGSLAAGASGWFAYRLRDDTSLAGNAMSVWLSYLLIGIAWNQGGFDSPTLHWFVLVPMMPLFLTGLGTGLVWSAASVAIITGLYAMDVAGFPFPEIQGVRPVWMELFLVISVMSIVLLFGVGHSWASNLAVKEAQEARGAAELASRVKSEFLANVSHELRTPINGIMGMNQLLDGLDLDDDGRVCVETIDDSARRLLSTVQGILDLASLEEDDVVVNPVDQDLRELVSTIARTYEGRASLKKVTFEAVLDPRLPERVLVDRQRLSRALGHLLDNAVKFTSSGTITVSATILERGEKDRIEFVVKDTGIGMSKAVLDRVSQPFYQVDSSLTRRFGGTGVGLTVVKKVLRALGTDLEVESVEGVGSRFAFVLTVDPAPESAFESCAGQPRVLLVEDDRINQRVAVRMLERLDCEVTVAGDGLEALVAVELERFDLVLMDCQMPRMDGVTATRRIRASESLAERLPIVAWTAHASAQDAAACYAAGMDGYLTKPLQLAELKSTLARFGLRGPDGAAPVTPARRPEPRPALTDPEGQRSASDSHDAPS